MPKEINIRGKFYGPDHIELHDGPISGKNQLKCTRWS